MEREIPALYSRRFVTHEKYTGKHCFPLSHIAVWTASYAFDTTTDNLFLSQRGMMLSHSIYLLSQTHFGFIIIFRFSKYSQKFQ